LIEVREHISRQYASGVDASNFRDHFAEYYNERQMEYVQYENE